MSKSSRESTMRGLMQRLFPTAAAPRRVTLTPGRLYFLMSLDLRAARQGRGCRCSMPMLRVLAKPRPAACNWDTEPFRHQCPRCRVAAMRIVDAYRAMYDANAVELAEATSPPPPAPASEAEADGPAYRDGAWIFG